MPRRKPTSNVGAALTRLNAVQHGLAAEAPVIPGVESADDPHAHYEALVQDLAPVGAMETALVERIARLDWRLRRVDRYECTSIAVARDRVEFDFVAVRSRLGEGATSVADAEVRLEAARRGLELIEHLRDVPPDTPLAAADVGQALADLADAADELPEDYVEGIEEADVAEGWTAARLIAVLKALADRDGEDFAVLLIGTVTRARAVATGCERELAAIIEEIDRMRREPLLPDGPTLDRIIRYETAPQPHALPGPQPARGRAIPRAGRPTPSTASRPSASPGADVLRAPLRPLLTTDFTLARLSAPSAEPAFPSPSPAPHHLCALRTRPPSPCIRVLCHPRLEPPLRSGERRWPKAGGEAALSATPSRHARNPRSPYYLCHL